MRKTMPMKYRAASRERVLQLVSGAHRMKSEYTESELIAQRLLKESANHELQVSALISLSVVAESRGKLQEAINYIDNAIEVCKKTKNELYIGKVCYAASRIYIQQGKLKEAIQFLKRAEQAYIKTGNKEELSNICNAFGVVFRRQGKFCLIPN